ncbi:MAG: F0F1 ATP synthase subunit delta [Firmicutes bacterium]|nr:F0F1 ATP synthase subunit delta [Bacillota bacterium]
MPKILKKSSAFTAAIYQFPTTEEELPRDTLEGDPSPAIGEQPQAETPLFPTFGDAFRSASHTREQAENALSSAELQARDILENARKQGIEEARLAYEKAMREGYEEGYAKGLQQGRDEAYGEVIQLQLDKTDAMATEVAAFLQKGERLLEEQLEQNKDELRELAIAVAEKVIAVSLKSSSEVVGRMIQAAVDKRKRREWVRIYVSESAGQVLQLSPSLRSALAGISDQVRIIPMDDDDPGMCIIEMPDEIVDASANTQLNNIRAILSDLSYDDGLGN